MDVYVRIYEDAGERYGFEVWTNREDGVRVLHEEQHRLSKSNVVIMAEQVAERVWKAVNPDFGETFKYNPQERKLYPTGSSQV